MIEKGNYITIQGWMVTELELKGNDLLIYAIIYGFTQASDDQFYTGTLGYLADWTNLSKVAVMNILNRLMEKGYIIKVEEIRNGVKFCKYRADLTGGKETLPGVKNLIQGGKESLPGGGKESLPNNNIDKDIKEKNNNKGLEAVLSQFVIEESVKESIREFIKMRKTIKAPMTERALTLMINKLREMSLDPEVEIAILNQSIENSWKGLYPLKKATWTSKKPNWDVNRENSDPYDMIARIAEGM